MALHEPLDRVESRILGVLVEKELTTPDGYPLSLNALINGCNQRSNRDPVVNFDEQTVNGALLRMRLHHLVKEVHAAGARVVKYAHTAREALGLEQPALAVLAELLLRGPQTAGELRGRASRMAGLESLEAADAVLEALIAAGLVRRLPPSPGSRANRYEQLAAPGLHGTSEGAAPAGRTAAPHAPPPGGLFPLAAPAATSAPTAARPAAPQPPLAAAPAGSSADGATLARRVTALEERIEALERRLAASPQPLAQG